MNADQRFPCTLACIGLSAMLSAGCLNYPRNGQSLPYKAAPVEFQGYSGNAVGMTPQILNHSTGLWESIPTSSTLVTGGVPYVDSANQSWFPFEADTVVLPQGAAYWVAGPGSTNAVQVRVQDSGGNLLNTFEASTDQTNCPYTDGADIINHCVSAQSPNVTLTVPCGMAGATCCLQTPVINGGCQIGTTCVTPLAGAPQVGGTCVPKSAPPPSAQIYAKPTTQPAEASSTTETPLTAGQVNTIVNWIQREWLISQTSFCWKPIGYMRGGPYLPSCGSGQYENAGLCYPDCAAGFAGVGPLCVNQNSPYYPGTHKCDCVHIPYVGDICGQCVDSCRDGYVGVGVGDAEVCTPSPLTYGNGVGALPSSCPQGQAYQALMCFDAPQDGFTCAGNYCSYACAAGTTDCGPLACANSATNCGMTAADMTMSLVQVIAFSATCEVGCEGGAIVDAIRSTASLQEVAQEANTIAQLTNTLYGDLDNFLVWSQTNLAATSTPAIEATVASAYARGGYNYTWIAQEWAVQELLFSLLQTETDLSTFIETAADITGVTATAASFDHPQCMRDEPMP